MIGANNVQGAKVYAQMCTLTAFLWAIASVLVINVLQDSVIGVFSSSPVVNDLIAKAYSVISVFVFFDCT